MAKSDDILREVKFLKVKLYGENGFEGDIEEIKAFLKNHDKRISRNSRILFTIIGILSASGAGYGLFNWLG